VVALDTRGYGDSDKPAGMKHYCLQYLIDDVAAIVHKLGKLTMTNTKGAKYHYFKAQFGIVCWQG